MVCVFMSMHEDLHCFPHSPQSLHFEVSMTGLKMLLLENRPRMVPTGQMLLHHVRPPVHASSVIVMSVRTAAMSTGIVLIQTSVSYIR